MKAWQQRALQLVRWLGGIRYVKFGVVGASGTAGSPCTPARTGSGDTCTKDADCSNGEKCDTTSGACDLLCTSAAMKALCDQHKELWVTRLETVGLAQDEGKAATRGVNSAARGTHKPNLRPRACA